MMTYALTRLDWYDLIILGLAILIVYPDQILLWMGKKSRHVFHGWHVILFEVVAVVLMIVSMVLLRSIYAKLEWWDMLICVVVVGGVRCFYWLSERVFRGFFKI
jgi:hypothetical protein